MFVLVCAYMVEVPMFMKQGTVESWLSDVTMTGQFGDTVKVW